MRHTGRPYLLCDATPFCYGPASCLQTLLKAMNLKNHRAVVLASSTTMELLQGAEGVDLIRCNTQDPADLIRIRRLAHSAKLILIISNRISYKFLNLARPPKVFVDFLYWMRAKPQIEPHYAADLYLIENYPGTATMLSRYQSLVSNPKVVPPIVQQIEKEPDANRSQRILVTYGGLESWLSATGRTSDYASLMTEALLKILPLASPRSAVLFTGSRTAMELLSKRFPQAGPIFKQLSHSAYLEQLRSAAFLLAHPGLYSPFEAFLSRTPVFFLPPTNYTDLLQGRYYKRYNIAPFYSSWEDLPKLNGKAIEHGLDESKGVPLVLGLIRKCANDASLKKSFQQRISAGIGSFLSSGTATLTEKQYQFAVKYGVDGPRRAAELIRKRFRLS